MVLSWQRLLQQAYTATAAAVGWVAGLYMLPPRRCCCVASVTLFSRVTLIRKLQSSSDLDHFHPRELPCSHVKSRDDPISGRRCDGELLHCFIYINGVDA